LSYFNLNKLESIYKAYFDKNEDLNIYEGILEATCCLIPERDIFESYKVLSSIYAGEKGTNIFGRTSKDRILMLITMMKIYERNHKIDNIIIHNFKKKSEFFYSEYKLPLSIGSVYLSSKDRLLKIRTRKQKVKHPLKKNEEYSHLHLV
jgi:hypothetical protein